jgi:uncharacterized protein
VAQFWDTSAIIPLLLREDTTLELLSLLRDDERMTVWWGTQIECVSALTRRMREGGLTVAVELQARAIFDRLTSTWTEIQPSDRVRARAERLLAVHPLRAADALKLASALVWTEDSPAQRSFVSLDNRLRQAARKEGFAVRPTDSGSSGTLASPI